MPRSLKSKTKPAAKSRLAQPAAPAAHFSFEAIGTGWTIDLYEAIDVGRQKQLHAAIMARIEQFDRDYSRFRDDSLVATMAGAAGRYRLPADARPMLDLYRRLYELSNGAVTPLIGQVLVDAGYDAAYSLRQNRALQTPPTWDEALDYQWPYLTLKQPALLDFGAAGKGYLVDIVADLIVGHDVGAFCVDAGGDIVCCGLSDQPQPIGLEHPDDANQVIGVARIGHGSLCGSAGNRRSWGEWHHIIDPQQLRSPRHIRAVWVCAESALVADGLTTALFFASPAKLAEHYDFEYAIVRQDYSLKHSTDFPAEFFLADMQIRADNNGAKSN